MKRECEAAEYRRKQDYKENQPPPCSGWSDAPRGSCRSKCQVKALLHPKRGERGRSYNNKKKSPR